MFRPESPIFGLSYRRIAMAARRGGRRGGRRHPPDHRRTRDPDRRQRDPQRRSRQRKRVNASVPTGLRRSIFLQFTKSRPVQNPLPPRRMLQVGIVRVQAMAFTESGPYFQRSVLANVLDNPELVDDVHELAVLHRSRHAPRAWPGLPTAFLFLVDQQVAAFVLRHESLQPVRCPPRPPKPFDVIQNAAALLDGVAQSEMRVAKAKSTFTFYSQMCRSGKGVPS